MATRGLSDEIDSCEYLYLRELSEPRDNASGLMVEEARVSPNQATAPLPGIDISAQEIISDSRCQPFELVWTSYIAYSVTNESCTTVDESERIDSGRLIRSYSESKFLDCVKKGTIASEDYPGPHNHVQLICLNHGIDVVSTSTPEIRTLRQPNRVSAIQ